MPLLDRDELEPVGWLLLGLLLGGIVAVALYTYLGSFLFAVFLYYASRPLYRRINDRLDHPDLAVSLTLLIVVLPMAVVLVYGLLQALQALDRFLAATSLSGYRTYLQPYLSLARAGNFDRLWRAIVTNPEQPLTPLLRRALAPAKSVASLLWTVGSRTFLMALFLFYLLRDDRKIAAWVNDTIDASEELVNFVQVVDDDLETVFVSNLLLVAVAGGIAAIVYFLLNLLVPAGDIVGIPILLGVLIGLATLVPIIGMKLVYVPYTGYLTVLAVTGQIPAWYPIVFLVVTFVIIDTIPDLFLRSFLAARSSINLGLVLLGYVLGTMTYGWMGLFLGPIIVVVGFHFAHQILPEMVPRLTRG